jgi:hypothetical protein
MVATRLSSPKSRHEVPRTQRTSFAICDLLFAIANDPQASSSSSCRTACLPHLMNGSRSGMPRERKNRSQAKEMLWVRFGSLAERSCFVGLAHSTDKSFAEEDLTWSGGLA